MYVVKFTRVDRSIEEYFYHREKDGLSHLQLFKNDDSGLYSKIELIIEGVEDEVVDRIEF